MGYSKYTIRPTGLASLGGNAWDPGSGHTLNGVTSDNSDATYADSPRNRWLNIYPVSNGTQTGVTVVGGVPAWSALADNTNSTYIHLSGVPTALCQVNMGNLPPLLPSESIIGLSVGITVAGLHTNLTQKLIIGGTHRVYGFWPSLNYRSPTNVLSAGAGLDPSGNVWTPASVNALVLEISSDTAYYMYRAWIGVLTTRSAQTLDLNMGTIPGGLPPAGYASFSVQPRFRYSQSSAADAPLQVQLLQAAVPHNVIYDFVTHNGRTTSTAPIVNNSGAMSRIKQDNSFRSTGVPFTPADINSGVIMRVFLQSQSATFRLYEAYLDVLWNSPANTPFHLSPSGNTEQLAPVFTWDYSDPEDDPQRQAQVQLFTDAQHTAGIVLGTTKPIWQMPITNTGKHSVVCGAALQIGTKYWWYVRVNSDGSRWSAWANTSVTITAPPRINYVANPTTPASLDDHGPPITQSGLYASYLRYDGSYDQYIYIVPLGCTRIMLDAWGGCGTAGSDGDAVNVAHGLQPGGSGGYVGRLLLSVSPGERIWISFNSITPGSGGSQGINGQGGDGGMAVDIRRGAFTQANRIVVVGGGGGGGGQGQDFYTNVSTNYGGWGGPGGDPQSTGSQGSPGVNGAIGGHAGNGQTPGQPGDSTPYTKAKQTQDTWAGGGSAPYALAPAPAANRFEDSEHAGNGGVGGLGDDAPIFAVYHTHPERGGGGGGGGAGYPSGAGGGGGAQDSVSGASSPFYASGGGGGSGGSSWVAPEIRNALVVSGITYTTRGQYPTLSAFRGACLITPNPPVVTITSPAGGSDQVPLTLQQFLAQQGARNLLSRAVKLASNKKVKLDVSGGLTVTWTVNEASVNAKGQASYSIRRRSVLSTLHEYWNGFSWAQGEGLMDTPNNTWQPGGESFVASANPTGLTLGWVPGGTWAISVAIIDRAGAYSQYSEEVIVEVQAAPNTRITRPEVDINGVHYSQLLKVTWTSKVYSSLSDPAQLAYQLKVFSSGLTQTDYFDPDVFVGDVWDSDLVFTDDNVVDLPVVLDDSSNYAVYLRIAQNNMQWSEWNSTVFSTAAFTNAPVTLVPPNVLVGMNNIDYLTAPQDPTQYDTNGVYLGPIPEVDITLDTTDANLWVADVQRSVDQITWDPVRLTTQVVTDTIQDYEFPTGQTVYYRVRLAGLCTNTASTPPINGVAYSDWSVPQSVDVPQGIWAWMNDPLEPGSATPMMLQMGGAIYSTPERQQVFNLMGSASPVIVADVVGYDSITLQVDMVNRPMMASFLAMHARQRVVCLQGNNDVAYVRLSGSFAKPYTTANITQAQGTALVVDMPEIPANVPVTVMGGQAIELDTGIGR